jgi:hypothetical protein
MLFTAGIFAISVCTDEADGKPECRRHAPVMRTRSDSGPRWVIERICWFVPFTDITPAAPRQRASLGENRLSQLPSNACLSRSELRALLLRRQRDYDTFAIGHRGSIFDALCTGTASKPACAAVAHAGWMAIRQPL